MKERIINIKEKRFFYIVTFLLLCVFYSFYHLKVIVSSDSVSMIPLALDILNGNVLLKDWIVGTNNFLFTETIFYLPGLALGVSCITLEALISSITFAGIVVGSAYVFFSDTKHEICKALFFYASVGVVSLQTSYTLLNANSHNGCYLFLALEYFLIFYYEKSRKSEALILYTLLGILVMYSDSITLMVLIVPMICYDIYYIFYKWIKKKKSTIKTYTIELMCTMLIWIFAKGISKAVEFLGGLETRGLPIHIVSLDQAIIRLVGYKDQFLLMWGYKAGSDVGVITTIYNFLIIILIFFTFVSVISCLRKILKGTIDNKELILLLIVLFNWFGCICTDTAIFHRYLVPMYLYGVILAILFCYSFKWSLENILGKFYYLVIAGLGVGCLFISGYRINEVVKQEVALSAERQVAAYIQAKDYGDGYGQFWCASLNASMTDFTNNIIPIYTTTSGFARYPELIKKSWYEADDIHYIVCYSDDTLNEVVNFRLTDIIEFLGDPIENTAIGSYQILYWDKDISSFLQE